MTEQPPTPNTFAAAFPNGLFTYTAGEASPVVEFDGQGGVTVTLEGEVIVIGAYKVNGDVLEIVDKEGPYSNPEFGVGKYKWNLAGKILTFSLIEDESKPRSRSFALPWVKIE